MYFQRKSQVKQNRPSVCNYHQGSHATAPHIRFPPRPICSTYSLYGWRIYCATVKVFLTLVGLTLREVYGVRPCRCGPNGVDTISVNEHTDYVTVTLDASAMSLVAGMNPYGHTVSASSRAKPCYPDGRSNPGKRE